MSCSRAVRVGWAAVAMLVGALSLVVSAQTIQPRRLPGAVVAPVTARGISGQFIVQGASSSAPRVGIIPDMAPDLEELELEPQWLAVTAERVKTAVVRRFDSPDRWKGKIHLNIRPARELAPGPVRIVPVSFPGGYQYRVDLPEKMPWRQLVRTLVEVILLEAANREAGGNLGLPPLWLNEGMTALVLADQGRDLILQAHTAVIRNERKPSILAEARRVLGDRSPLLFSELSFPPESLPSDAAEWPVFQASAALLVHELMSDAPGRSAVGEFIGLLPQYLNWQMAFLRAYRARFLTVLEVEKWWAVNATHVLSRDPSQLWSPQATLEHLAGILVETAELGGTTNAPGRREAVPLADVILRWEPGLQAEVIRRKQEQVRDLYRHAPQAQLPLVNDLHRILQAYADARYGGARDALRRAELETRSRLVAAKAARQLRDFEARLNRIRNPDPRGIRAVEADRTVPNPGS